MIINYLEKEKVLSLKNEIKYLDNNINKEVLYDSKTAKLILFSFDKDTGLNTHKTTADAFVNIIEGSCKIIIDNKEYLLNSKESIIIPSNKKHSLYALEKFKMILFIGFKEE